MEDIKKEFIDAINSREFRDLMKDNLDGQISQLLREMLLSKLKFLRETLYL